LQVHQAYYCATRPESVDIEDWLNAWHCVDPDNGMQFCATATGAAVSAMTRNDLIADGWCFLFERRRLSPMADEDPISRKRAN